MATSGRGISKHTPTPLPAVQPDVGTSRDRHARAQQTSRGGRPGGGDPPREGQAPSSSHLGARRRCVPARHPAGRAARGPGPHRHLKPFQSHLLTAFPAKGAQQEAPVRPARAGRPPRGGHGGPAPSGPPSGGAAPAQPLSSPASTKPAGGGAAPGMPTVSVATRWAGGWVRWDASRVSLWAEAGRGRLGEERCYLLFRNPLRPALPLTDLLQGPEATGHFTPPARLCVHA